MIAAVIGDINLDSVVDLSGYDLSLEEVRNGCLFERVDTVVGGNGVFFAEAAKESAFEQVFLLGCVGAETSAGSRPDAEGEVALRRLGRMGVDTRSVVVTSGTTGKVLILYQAGDRRLLIADRGANERSCSTLFDAARALPSEVDLLYVSGYWLVDDKQHEAVLSIVDLLKERGAFVLVDVVPHDLFTRLSCETFLERIVWADGVAAEASTITGFVGSGQRKAEESVARFVLEVLGQCHELCIVRLNRRSDFLVKDRYGHEKIYFPYRPRLNSLRFTDRAVAFILRRYLEKERSLWPSSDWIEGVRRRVSSQLLGG